ncbi:hypothetical protein [Nonomuraea glycinis]|uniref:hypothetical protein n=1 Tax=Nonomuraea glycinis TaxID=2047744 RepID=UPI0033A1DA3B
MHELVALAVEEVGLLAAEHRRKKPLKVPRPGHFMNAVKGNRRQMRTGGDTGGSGMDRAFNTMLATRRGIR